jgi:dTDP-4-dehydrorhamnose reductase
MKILLTGKTGQVGYELERSLQGLGTVIALDRNQMDLANLRQVCDVVRAVQPDLIVNTAAYTAVDKAESEPELAMLINGEAPGVMADEARKLGAAIIHYSTDYVFDGAKRESHGEMVPYTEDDAPNPINVYGESKLAGEQAISASGCPHLILRISWIYSMRGQNFLTRMLQMAREQSELRIVADQFGAPTWSRTIAELTTHAIAQSRGQKSISDWWHEKTGTYHLAAQGRTTWCGFGQAIVSHPSIVPKPIVMPIESKDYARPARRPANSLMSCERWVRTFSCCPPSWDKALELCQPDGEK